MSNDLKPIFFHTSSPLLQVMEERQRIKSLANGEPILQAFKIVGVFMWVSLGFCLEHPDFFQASEPLLLEHFHCSTPIVAPWLDIMTSAGGDLQATGTEALYWHQIMGIFSISTTGHVVVADSCGVQTFAIHEAGHLICPPLQA